MDAVLIAGAKKLGKHGWVSETVGWKALGIYELPVRWVPSFFVLSSDLHRQWFEAGCEIDDSKPCPIDPTAVEKALASISSSQKNVLIRSSGVAEDFESRGRFESLLVRGNVSFVREGAVKIWRSVATLQKDTPDHPRSAMPLIIQRAVTVRLKGHLSNERRVSKKAEDWIVEIEGATTDGIPQSLSIRLKKADEVLPKTPIVCASREEVIRQLRRLAASASLGELRKHFEWVWDGVRLWVVQSDTEATPGGSIPGTTWNRSMFPPSINKLDVMVEAGNAKGEWKKTKSLRELRDCGLPTAKVYVLEDSPTQKLLAQGKVSEKLRNDINRLLQVPVVIRSDVRVFGDEFPALSPRTPTLSTAKEVLAFLTKQSKAFIVGGVVAEDFCYLMHHFIPARSGAYSLSRPDNPRVRIDSTWGLPDGLLAYPHDSFEMDSRNPSKIQRHLRCKTDYIDVDESGDWTPHRCKPPHDWMASLTDSEIREIAGHSARVSELLKKPVEIMFFVGVDTRSGHPACLPWLIVDDVPDFEKQEANFHYAGKSFPVDTEAALVSAKAWIQQERVHGKVFLKLRPRPELLRSKTFVNRVAALALEHHVPIELEGSVLSHFYYMLRKAGVSVRCVEAFHERLEHRRFGKLVRDLIPVKIEAHGESARVVRLPKDELVPLLKAKAVEEAFELFWESDPVNMFEELADLLEVVRGMCAVLNRSMDDLEKVADAKKGERGGFEEGIVLIDTREVPLTAPKTPHELFPDDVVDQVMAQSRVAPGASPPKLRKDSIVISAIPPTHYGGTSEFLVSLTDFDLDLSITYRAKELRIAVKRRQPTESPNQLQFTF